LIWGVSAFYHFSSNEILEMDLKDLMFWADGCTWLKRNNV